MKVITLERCFFFDKLINTQHINGKKTDFVLSHMLNVIMFIEVSGNMISFILIIILCVCFSDGTLNCGSSFNLDLKQVML